MSGYATSQMLTATGRPWTWQNVQRVEASLRLDNEAAQRTTASGGSA